MHKSLGVGTCSFFFVGKVDITLSTGTDINRSALKILPRLTDHHHLISLIYLYLFLFSDKMAVVIDNRCWGALYVVLALLSLTIPRMVEAQPGFCVLLNEAFGASGCECRGALDDDGVETLDLVLDCSNKDLTSVPVPVAGTQIPNRVIHEFILTNNKISRLETNSFSGFKVRSLDLSGNAIASVADDAFDPLIEELRELKMDGDLSGGPQGLSFLTYLEVLTLRDYNVDYLGDSVGATPHVYFLGLNNLKHLTLEHWQIQAFEPEAFKGPVSLESLTIKREKDVAQLPLAVLFDDSLKSLTSLTISGTSIREVTNEAFSQLSNLRELDLSGNFINQIRQKSFDGLSASLKKLSLASNFLRSDISDMDGLRGLPNLEELDLSGNEEITDIPDFSNLNLDELTSIKVFLGKNKIGSLSSNAFSGIAQRLHTLDLSENSISNMDQGSFNGVTNLQVLHLSQQSGMTGRVLTLPNSLSQSADSLTHLFLDGQNLQESSLWGVVSFMAKLEVLDLRNAGLNQLPNLALQRMTVLRELYLSGNSLTSLSQENFIGPRDTLKKLYLSQNPLTSISSCVFAHYTSFPITLALKSAPLLCDCQLGWLHKSARDGHIVFDPEQAPSCSNYNDEPLLSKGYDTICPDSGYTDDSCDNPYTTPPPPTAPETPSLTLRVEKTTSDSITLSWRLSDSTDARSFAVRITNDGDSEFLLNNIRPRIFQVEAKPLRPDTSHRVCVIANFYSINSITECTVTRTEKGNGSDPQGQTDNSSSDNAGIIIGAVVGAALLLIVLAAIGYLVFIRRKPKKGSGPISGPVMPRNFAKSELPSMTDDSRTFTRPKRPNDQHDGMQVVAISDGQFNDRQSMNGNARVGRAARLYSDGSYKLMSGGASSNAGTSTSSVSGDQSVYENDHGLLPKTPPYHDHGMQGPRQPYYYNKAFETDKYDEVDLQREVTL